MGVEIRVVLKPILYKIPIIGGMQIFFLNIPDIDFELEGITSIPGFRWEILDFSNIINGFKVAYLQQCLSNKAIL